MTRNKLVLQQRGRFHKIAERLLRKNSYKVSQMPDRTLPQLVHDLAMHQIEMELQARGLHKARLGMEELRAAYRKLYDCAPVGYLTLDREGVISNANPSAARLLGVERELLIDKPFSSFLDTGFQEAFSLHHRNVVDSEGRKTCELVVKRGDGSCFRARMESIATSSRRRAVVLSALMEMTGQDEQGLELRESEERYRVAIESSNDGVVITRGEKILHVNRRLLDMLGCDNIEEVVGRDVGFAVHPDDRARIMNYARRRQTGEETPSRYEFRGIRRDGSLVFIEASVSRIAFQGQPASLAYLRDITERKQAERRQGLVNRILETLNGPGEITSVIDRILLLMKEHTGIEAVSMRLRKEGDFPFVGSVGPSERPQAAGRPPYGPDKRGKAMAGDPGGPRLSCPCARVLRGRIDPSLPFFTKAGSFWTNSVTGLPESFKGEPKALANNCCMLQGYESMALVPLKSGEEIMGLLLFNDKLPDRYNPAKIEFVEGMAASIGMALARREAEERIYASERKYRSIFENALEGIYQSSPAGRLINVNPALARIHGYASPEEMVHDVDSIGKKLWVHREDLARYVDLIRRDGVVRGFEAEQYRKDGTTYWASLNTHAVRDQDGKIVYYEGIIEDVTERKRLEDHLRQTQKMEAIGTLSAGIAHDFNNILTAILGFADLAFEDAVADSKAKRHLAKILGAAERGKELVKQILSFSRKSEEELRPTALASVVTESIRMLRASLPKTIEMRVDIPNEPSIVFADATQIQQIIMNLATNAAHAMWQKGGLMTVDLACMTVASENVPEPGLTPGSYCKLSISDTGTGMERDVLERVFDPFFTTKKRGEGTGLGLWVVQAIVKNHKGVITVRSTPGKGSTFEVFLPRVPEQDAPAVEPPLSALKGQGHLLIVDDEADLVELEKAMVERLGYTATAVSESVAALALFKEDPGRYDLVLTDQTMPNMTGLDLAQELISIRPDIPVVLVTGYRDMVNTEAVRQSGVKVLLMKPMTRAEIGKTIKQLLGRESA